MKHILLIRLGGLAAMVGGVIYASAELLDLHEEYQVGFGGAGTLIGGGLFFILLQAGAMAATAALAALYHLQQGQSGSLGALASVVAFVGVTLTLIGELGVSVGTFLSGLLLTILVIPALGIASMATRTLPWWGGAALAAAIPLFVVSMEFTVPWNGTLAGVAWVLVGYAIFRAGAHQAEQPSRVR